MRAEVIHGDCLDVMRGMEPGSVDAIVTDPPYGLEFMGKEWDKLAAPTGGAGFSEASGKPDQREGHEGCTWFGSRKGAAPSFNGSPNPSCRNCGGSLRGNDRKGGFTRCRCENPDFPNHRLAQAKGMQDWHHAWAVEALRVAKPGAHLLAAGGTRTWHRLTCAIEDAGWEIRDTICWLHGVGFPKSRNVSKDACFCSCSPLPYSHDTDKVRGVRKVVSSVPEDAAASGQADLLAPVQRETARRGVSEALGEGSRRLDGVELGQLPAEYERAAQPGVEGRRHDLQDARPVCGGPVRPSARVGEADGASGRLRDGAPAGDGPGMRSAADAHRGCSPSGPSADKQCPAEPGTLAGQPDTQAGGAWPVCGRCGKPMVPAGLGTALKPAVEFWVLARKPLVGTVAANVAAHGTGALNIDGCRIETGGPTARPPLSTNKHAGWKRPWNEDEAARDAVEARREVAHDKRDALGRWPANVVLDEDAARTLDEQSGETGAFAPVRRGHEGRSKGIYGDFAQKGDDGASFRGDSGGASRFFYCAKASRAEREAGLTGPEKPLLWSAGTQNPGSFQSENTHRAARNHHPTVKPVALMRWLVRLVTPPGGLVLDPFTDSGTTGVVAVGNGRAFLGAELNPEYVEIARRRIADAQAQGNLFAEAANQ